MKAWYSGHDFERTFLEKLANSFADLSQKVGKTVLA
jgi:hypothetical protein